MHLYKEMNVIALAQVYSIVRSVYSINEPFLKHYGFVKNENLSGYHQSVFRYYNPANEGNGFELSFVKEFGVVSIDEFWLADQGNEAYTVHKIVGEFRISSDDDLLFIFSRNVRLNYIFNVANKRI